MVVFEHEAIVNWMRLDFWFYVFQQGRQLILWNGLPQLEPLREIHVFDFVERHTDVEGVGVVFVIF